MRDSLKRELISIVGDKRASDRPEDLVVYSYDAYTVESLPDLVLFPTSTEEVVRIMKIAYRENIPVTARGAGTNVAGESVPVRGGIALVFTRMDRILEIDAGNRRATVQPGVITNDLQQAAARLGLMYPPDPSSLMVATIGGNVATNAGGPRTVKYGVTSNYLLGLRVVLADGRVLETGSGKESPGFSYDLTNLICGSEGTLGLVTRIAVRLIPAPAATRTLRAHFARLDDCGRAVAAIIRQGIVPTALELMDRGITREVEQVGRLGLPLDAEGVLLIEVDGEPESLENQVERIKRVLADHHASGILAARDGEEADRLWAARRLAFSAMARLRPNSVTEDATVPVSKLPAMIEKVREIAERHHVQIGVLAHAGDGNLLPLILFDRRDEEEVRRVEAASQEIFREALAMDGTLSGEHGIGLAKAPFLPLQLDPVARTVTRSLKRALDPKGILNPGKFL